jgi:hypothetical protein
MIPGVTCIVCGPTKVLLGGSDGDRWCFSCRKRLPHTWEVLGYEEPSYYDPIRVCKCSRCGKDRTDFPRGW